MTDVGLVRNENQDAAFVRCDEASGDIVVAVADGMGGMPAGARASALAIAASERPTAADIDPARHLRAVMQGANEAIAADIAAVPNRSGMGTTLVVVLIRGAALYVAHVGDSRAYLWREGALLRLTADHSVAGELVASGELDAAAALTDSRRHLLVRAAGGRRSEPDLDGPYPFDEGAVALLVSDGICGVLDDERIAETVREQRGEAIAARLVELAYGQEAPDNIAVALADSRL